MQESGERQGRAENPKLPDICMFQSSLDFVSLGRRAQMRPALRQAWKRTG